MNQHSLCRPLAENLTFQGFDRPVHPELIESIQTRSFDRDGYVLRVHLTSAGHLLEWRQGARVLVELLADQTDPLPEQRQLFAHRVGGERMESHAVWPGISYQTCFQLERLPQEFFFHFHDELRSSARESGILLQINPRDRLGFSPVSYIDLQARPGSLIVHSYHTYPDEFAIVKIQSLIEAA